MGALVNGYFEPGKTVAYPAPVSEAMLARFGPAPAKAPGGARFDAAVTGRSGCCASTCSRSSRPTW